MNKDILAAIQAALDFVETLTAEGSEPTQPELFEEVEEFSHENIQRLLA